MWSRVKAWCRRWDCWVLCGVGLALVLVLARWWVLNDEGEALQLEVQRTQAELEELQPIIEQVNELKTRQDRLQSLIVDLIERPRLFKATEAVLTASQDDVDLERLDVHGLEVRILARADDDQAIRSFLGSLQESRDFLQIGKSEDAVDDPPVPPRFVVHGELDMPWPEVEE